MTSEALLAYCLAKPGAWQDEPREGDVVAKAGPKIFGRSGWNSLQAGSAMPGEEITEAVDGCYDMVVSKLPTKDRLAHA
ncbi:MAG TPA: hypothetical protein VG142_00085 [Trebonia sp.]|jgi:predicted DNA-binding protein (MmcQ/YjbR family)|nr:hypothetical protein [Trebonia sp.]